VLTGAGAGGARTRALLPPPGTSEEHNARFTPPRRGTPIGGNSSSSSSKGGIRLSKRQAKAVRRRMQAQADAIRAMTVQLGAAMA